MEDLVKKISEGFANDIEKQMYTGATTATTATTSSNAINTSALTMEDIIEANNKMMEFGNKVKMFSELQVIIGVSKKKQRAKHFFKKNLNKLGFGKSNYEKIDTLVITDNPSYKKWSIFNKFRGKNPKYQVLGVNREFFKLKPTDLKLNFN